MSLVRANETVPDQYLQIIGIKSAIVKTKPYSLTVYYCFRDFGEISGRERNIFRIIYGHAFIRYFCYQTKTSFS